MKQLTFSFVSGVLLLFCSCDSDDNIVVTEDLVSGTWNLERLEYSERMTTSVAGQSTSSSLRGSAVNIDLILTFAADQQLATSTGNYENEITRTTDDVTTTTIGAQADKFIFDGSWSIEGNRITVQELANRAEYVVLELTDNQLVLSLNNEITESFSGNSESERVSGFVVFER